MLVCLYMYMLFLFLVFVFHWLFDVFLVDCAPCRGGVGDLGVGGDGSDSAERVGFGWCSWRWGSRGRGRLRLTTRAELRRHIVLGHLDFFFMDASVINLLHASWAIAVPLPSSKRYQFLGL